MLRAYRTLFVGSWGLGILGTVGGVVLRVVPGLEAKTGLSARGFLILAGVLFLCALATREMEQVASSRG
jgi:hypothetical protein